MLTFTTSSAEETITLGEKIGRLLKKGDIIAMQGTLAAGKTTITKGIAKALGITDTITSPTFCLISEYQGTMPLYHMDVYRLDGTEDFINLGTDDMLYGDGGGYPSYASAAALILFAIVMTITCLNMLIRRKHVYY